MASQALRRRTMITSVSGAGLGRQGAVARQLTLPYPIRGIVLH